MPPAPAPPEPPPEVLAIAVALALTWPVAAAEIEELAPAEPSPWPTGGRRWRRATSYTWS